LETRSPTCYQDHVKGKIGKYPDFGEKPENILILGKKPEYILIFWGKNQKIS
jgi:hypothetical protein